LLALLGRLLLHLSGRSLVVLTIEPVEEL
jgi:hypothetical protein